MRRGDGAIGVFRGIGTGLAGLLAKPIAGLLDLSASALRATSEVQ